MVNLTLDVIKPESAKTLQGLFNIRAEKDPDKIAYRYFDYQQAKWCEYTWQKSLEKINQWRKALVGSGLKPGDSVSMMIRNCPEWIFIEQACMSEGIISVPLYPNDRADNIAHIVNEAEVKLILIENHLQWEILKEAQTDFLAKPVIISMDTIQDDSPVLTLHNLPQWIIDNDKQQISEIPHQSNPKSLATIVYTSGTTGRPKGVMLSHWNILSNAYSGISAVNVYKEDLFLSFLPLSHTLERTIGYYLPLMCGSTVAFARSVPQLAEDLLTIKPTVLISVPRIYERVYSKIIQQLEIKSPIAKKLFQLTTNIGWSKFEFEQGRQNKPWQLIFWPLLNKIVAQKVLDKLGGRLRFTISGGAPLPEKVSHLFIALGLRILQGYGLTETSPVISVNTFESDYPASIGKPLPGVQVKIADNDELLTKSECVMLGYWKNEEATQSMFTEDGWLKTGDLARIENEHIYITGRIKEILVLSNGEKVPPVDMEMAICLNPLIEQALVIGEARPFLSAVVVLEPEQWKILASDLSIDPDEPSSLQNHQAKQKILDITSDCLCDFPGYAQIRQITLSLEPWTDSNFLLTASLKMRRATLLKHFEHEIEKMYEGH
ncbi:MAG: long-chain fatty acid--CoA ligase [Gammaproteobacteria bacterium]|nr:long-chain fatty acid--CoA ligase [Gammaproteobacteria bacterium]